MRCASVFVILNKFTTFVIVKLLIMNTIRKLPIGIQDFEYLRTNNFLYVDKTQYIYQLAQYSKPYCEISGRGNEIFRL